MSQDEAENLHQAFKELIGYIQSAGDMPENAINIDTHMMTQRAGELCRAAENAPPSVAAGLRPLMAALIEELDILATKLEQFTKDQKEK